MRTPNRRWQSGFIRRKASIARCVAEMAMATLLSRHGNNAPAGTPSFRRDLGEAVGVECAVLHTMCCLAQVGGGR